MEEKEMKDFSWTAFFIVSGISSFAFSKILYMLDGDNLPFFTWLGIGFLLTGTLNGLRVTSIQKSEE